jgi:Recq-mediated genome instability protein 1, C-terminal OB-fold
VKLGSKPFLYLRQLKTTKRKKAVIKATVISILRKLSTSNQRWSLLAKVADPTDFLDVELGNKVGTLM